MVFLSKKENLKLKKDIKRVVGSKMFLSKAKIKRAFLGIYVLCR